MLNSGHPEFICRRPLVKCRCLSVFHHPLEVGPYPSPCPLPFKNTIPQLFAPPLPQHHVSERSHVFAVLERAIRRFGPPARSDGCTRARPPTLASVPPSTPSASYITSPASSASVSSPPADVQQLSAGYGRLTARLQLVCTPDGHQRPATDVLEPPAQRDPISGALRKEPPGGIHR